MKQEFHISKKGILYDVYFWDTSNSCLCNLKSKLDLLGVLRKKYQILKWKVNCKKSMKDGITQHV